SRWSLTTAPGRCKRGTKCDQTQQHGRITHVQQEDKQIRVRRRRQRPAFPQPPPVAERLERNPLSLTILSLIQIALTPRFMVRAPKGLAVTLVRPSCVRCSSSLCKKASEEQIVFDRRKTSVRTMDAYPATKIPCYAQKIP